ncbi:LacI family transcriptional regulator [Aggregatimonas sangjinii]|uniref:LacI family transcriptional regulator n=1 Tax=Aggregatimonas sangjinii TaxID=2583587 RepID=A0A5B7STL2_9FLAO|nr:LacI family DNA-binding transcriptional regulator [Aggregatimonas sangjinii]QCX00679.1 LacI family transcriptional regulator [Aggregatimonas sangjinii]
MSKRGKIKLSDIAKEAGVSVSLVSYVLNDRHPNRINKETAKRIKDIAQRLNYRANPLAKGLRTKKSHTIALVLADLANPFSAQIARIIENIVIAKGYVLLIGSMDENIEKFKKLLDTFMNHEVDGLIIVPPEESEREIQAIHSQDIPYVLIDRYFPKSPFNFVVNDNHFSTYECVKRLVDLGKKEIAFVTQNNTYAHFLERKRGFLEACNDFGLQTDAKIIAVDLANLSEDVNKGIDTLLIDNPELDAILFATNILTLHGLKYAVKNKLRSLGKMELMGFDEAEFYDILPDGMMYYRQPLEEIGKRSVEFLMSDILNPRQQSIGEKIRGGLVETTPRKTE